MYYSGFIVESNASSSLRPNSCRYQSVVCWHCKQVKPVSELERLLQRIAPDKEVMIGISNYRLVEGGELVSFLEVPFLLAHFRGVWPLPKDTGPSTDIIPGSNSSSFRNRVYT